MQLSISDPKSGKAYSKKIEEAGIFLNKKLGETIELSAIGMQGYRAKIAGGSDKCGFPMHPGVSGLARKRLFIAEGTGFNAEKKGQKKRKNVRGNVIGTDINQLNLRISEYGSAPLSELFAGEIAKPKEEKKSVKEELVEQSLEQVGKVEIAGDSSKIKGKAKG